MFKFIKNYKWQIIVTSTLLLIALFLRTYKLTQIPVFVDEAIYIRWSQVMKAEPTLRFLPQSDGKQPLFMWVLMPFLKYISDPLVAGRLPSALTGIGTQVGVLVLSYILFKSWRFSLLAAFLYAISPFSVFFDRLALADAMLTAFGIWTCILGVLTVKYKRLDLAMLTGFALGGALLTKSPAIYFAILLPTTLLFSQGKAKSAERLKNIFIGLLRFVPSYAIAAVMYNILRLGPNFHMIALRNKDYVYPLSHILTSPLDPLKPFLHRSLEYFWILGPSAITVLILLGVYLGLKKYFKETIFLLAWGFIPIFISSEFSRTMTARYIYFSVPYFFILASICLPFLYRSTLTKVMVGTFLTVFTFHSFYLNWLVLTEPQKANLPRSERSGYLEDWTSGYGIYEVSRYLRQVSHSGEKVVVGTEGFFGTLPDGLQMYLNDTPSITVIGVGLSIEKVPDSLLASKAFGNKTYLVINDSRLFTNPEKIGFNVIASYPKAVRPDGTRETLLLLELNEESLKVN